ncbi:aminotransferase class V-fold PLP-dependent enzyme [Candidatus Poribacteria bacterium]|nr:aminotransferase class V-fold PLP-dependent enzyme [Candidatus Poribacteria bacterium]
MSVPFIDLVKQYKSIKEEIDQAISEVVESQYFVLGPKVGELEERIADYCQIKHGIGVASGTDALLLSLMALDIGHGDEVITTPFTFFATAGSISRLGAKPVFVDIDPKTYNINPQLIADKITEKTKAIIPVHLYGQCADMDPIMEIAEKNNLYVIEDAAQAIGAKYKGRMAGSIGHLGCLSFFPTKNLGGYGDGGMVLTNNKELEKKVRMLRVHGSKIKYNHSVVGLNSRLDAIQAAVLLAKLKYIDQWNESRRKNADLYNSLLTDLADVVTPFCHEYNYHIYHQYVVGVKDRDNLKEYLNKNEISTQIYYPIPLHLQDCYQELGYQKGQLPVSEKTADEVLALPIYSEVTKSQQEQIVNAIKDYLVK